jgi:hypothetical protein
MCNRNVHTVREETPNDLDRLRDDPGAGGLRKTWMGAVGFIGCLGRMSWKSNN